MSNSTTETHSFPPCLAMRPREAAAAIGISDRKLSELLADQTSGIPHLRLGKAVLFPVKELAEWLGQLARGAAK